ncbi:hypothetical protein ES708_18738 [subsurface metagenome]
MRARIHGVVSGLSVTNLDVDTTLNMGKHTLLVGNISESTPDAGVDVNHLITDGDQTIQYYRGKASENLLYRDPGIYSTSLFVYTKLVEILVPNDYLNEDDSPAGSIFRVYHELYRSGTQYIYTKIYVNDIAVGVEARVGVGDPTQRTEDISGIYSGDLIQIYGYVLDSPGHLTLNNFKIKGDHVLVRLPVAEGKRSEVVW